MNYIYLNFTNSLCFKTVVLHSSIYSLNIDFIYPSLLFLRDKRPYL